MEAQGWIVSFAGGEVRGTQPSVEKLGLKAAGLVELAQLGVPVPEGFTILTSACEAFQSADGWPRALTQELDQAVTELEERTGRTLGDPSNPLLLAIRSGASVPMPGMMDTVLDLGLNDKTVRGLAERTGDPRFAWDSYRRFIQMYGDIVLGVHHTRFVKAREDLYGGKPLEELSAEELAKLSERYRQVIATAGRTFPQGPREQLRSAIEAVYRSYNSHRARYYRKTHQIGDDLGVAVTVQRMVFGNRAESSGTGVLSTRNPKTGEPGAFGEWIPGAQGSDVSRGGITPAPLAGDSTTDHASLQERFPAVYDELIQLGERLEAHFRDLQELEFTLENGTLWALQTGPAPRSAQAAVRVVVDLAHEGVLSRQEALLRVDPAQLERMLRPIVAPDARRRVLATGLDASPGAACGRVVFHAADCQELLEKGEPSILVRVDTSPEDIQGMTVAQGVLTARGGQTSHAAVVARGMGKPAVVGCTEIQVDYSREVFYAGDTVIRRGDWITVDGSTGQVLAGQVPMLAPEADSGAMAELLDWADQEARLRVRANADSAPDAKRARALGAVGIGLCRTEHMFFMPEALRAIRKMILADDPWARQRALNDILPMQRAMFADIFREMDGLPVTVRLLDPPLHEFLPKRDEDISEVAEELGVRVEALNARLAQLYEANPMLGHRGVRLGISTPSVYKTQVRALFEAACEVTREGVQVHPEILVPLVALPEELRRIRDLIGEIAEEVLSEHGIRIVYEIGTMIEVPRACILADELAENSAFFSLGTNDLTQLVYGFSRDDMNKFLPTYRREGVLRDDPLSHFDAEGVGQLVRMACDRGRRTRPELKLGVCGEHAGETDAIAWFHEQELDYVSCSPFRVPVARLAAAHAALKG
ncbi:MAG: pyruvate, phosphate dikinase [Deltaproteobacteria bacterium]|nr:MAG: pyruvate, phosphate dikinase [Deltaproteobacteria bacterium]